jgi:hypothetical protein
MDYRSEDEALIGLARQLADAFVEAFSQDDREYAASAIAAFLSDHDGDAPAEAFVALLDLPLTDLTDRLIGDTREILGNRGASAVSALLSASLGHVYGGGPTQRRALESLNMMDERDLAEGLTQVCATEPDGVVRDIAESRLRALGAHRGLPGVEPLWPAG